jgi:hypothetical protein
MRVDGLVRYALEGELVAGLCVVAALEVDMCEVVDLDEVGVMDAVELLVPVVVLVDEVGCMDNSFCSLGQSSNILLPLRRSNSILRGYGRNRTF